MMLAAFFLPDRNGLSYAIVAVGFMLIALTCVLFLIKDVLPLLRVRQKVDENRELLDEIQIIALQLTEVASDLQALAFKNARDVADLLQKARPLLRQVAIVAHFADSDAIDRVDRLSSHIVTYTDRAKAVITDLQDALVMSDAGRLRKYRDELRQFRAQLEQLLKA